MEVVAPVDVPFDVVAVALRGEGFETVGFADAQAFLVGRLLVFLVVAVVGVEDVAKLADLVLEVIETYFGIVEFGI